MSAEDIIQKSREAEFNSLLNSADNDTPMLLFPLRIETHFRNSRPKAEEDDVIKILRRFLDLLDGFIEHKSDENFNFIPLMANIRRAVEVADFIPPYTLVDLSSLCKNIFMDIFYIYQYSPGYHKYDSYAVSIVNALRDVSKDKEVGNAVANASSTFILPRNAYGYLNFGQSSSAAEYFLLDFPGAANVFDTEELKAYRFLVLVENWIIALGGRLERKDYSGHVSSGTSPKTGSGSQSSASSGYSQDFPGASNLFDSPDPVAQSSASSGYSQDFPGASNLFVSPDPVAQSSASSGYSSGFPGSESLMDSDEPPAYRLSALTQIQAGAMEAKIAEQQNVSGFVAPVISTGNSGVQYAAVNSFTPGLQASVQSSSSSSSGYSPDFPGSENLLGERKELCVRIFPDEIFLDYLTDKLTEEEIADGKYFWLQWFIASGSRKREYEAWQVLCDKYPVYRAAWIARQLKPKNINDFKKDGKLFYRRPYPKMAEIEDACDNIYRCLAEILLNESESPKNPKENEYEVETQIRKYLGRVKENLFQIDCNVIFCEYIVDYLYDNILSTVEYLARRMDTFIAFYEKFPGRYGGNTRQMEIWDVDQTMLLTFRKEVDDFLVKLHAKRIPLDEMAQKYLDEPLHSRIFTFFDVNRSNKPDTPVSNIMPERFMFIGEAVTKETTAEETKMVYHYGRRVKRNLQLGINPNEDFNEAPYDINERGDLEIQGGLAWMVDYDKAEEAGMAITVPLENSIKKFNYVYVLGIKDADGREQDYLHGLFNSHNYTSSGLEMLKPDTPTNIVESGKPARDSNPEEEMLRRYEIEVEEAYKNERNKEYDSRILSDILNLDYEKCWGRTIKFDNRELTNAQKAYKALWEHFSANINKDDNPGLKALLDFTGDFVAGHVKARGALPSFRIGNKPYGVLPITDFLALDKNMDAGDLPQIKLLNERLVFHADSWKKIRKDKVISYDKLPGKDSAARYLEMAGLTPHSTTFYERALIGSPLLPKRLYPTTPYLQALRDAGYFDPLIVGGSEHEVSFGDKDSLLAGLTDIVKEALLKDGADPADDECALLVSEFLDLFTYRIDAWFSGILDYLLDSLRRSRGRYNTPMIGAFGWVFDLAENARTELSPTKRLEIINTMQLSPVNPSDDLRIYQNLKDDKGEYIIAPSIQHALSAAILRGAYLKTKATDGDSHMCVNLSSMRARQALRMISGIREGMSTGIILGADLERYLHEAYRMGGKNEYEMDKYIYPLRKLFPQTVDLKAEDERANDYVMHVINGEALLNTFMDAWGNSEPVADWLENNRSSEELTWYRALDDETGINGKEKHRKCLFNLIARMVDSYDALNDLLLAEGVHRLVQGDRATYSAISNFMAKGEGSLPEPAILDTPMEYVVVSNKVALALPECENPPRRPMCLAEPSVNLWLTGLMGDLKNIRFYIDHPGADGKTIRSCCTLGELGIAPIEYLYLSSNDNIFLSYLEARWRLKNDCFHDKVELYVDEPETGGAGVIFDSDVFDKGEDDFSLYENELRINRLHGLILRGGTMKASDWVASAISDAEGEMATDREDLKSRYVSLRTKLESLSDEMNSCLKDIEFDVKKDEKGEDENEEIEDPYSDGTLAKMYELLCRCVESGMINSLPLYNRGMFIFSGGSDDDEAEYHIHPIIQRLEFDRAIAMQQAFVKFFAYVRRQLEKRIAESEKIVPKIRRKTSNEPYASAQYIQAIKKLTLDNFKVFPRFTLHHDLPENKRKEYDKVMKQGIGYYANINRAGFEQWQSDLAEVREGVKTWHHLSMFENMRNGNMGGVSILQTTSDGDASLKDWLGCEVDSESKLCDVDSLVIYNSGAIADFATRAKDISWNAGIIIDAWPEFIPYKKQTAGMVFHCDQPDNEAPQALLLALHPEFNVRFKGKKWGLEHVLELLDSTRFMLMNRAVEPDHLYRRDDYSTLFPLLSTISIVQTFRFSSAFFTNVRGSGIASIFDLFPGGNLLK